MRSVCGEGTKSLLLCSVFNTFYVERIYCLEVKQPEDGTLGKKNLNRQELSSLETKFKQTGDFILGNRI